MYAVDQTSGRDEVLIRVKDLDRSRAFYQDLFGLRAEAAPQDERALASPDDGPAGFLLRLVPGEREGSSGDLWLSVQVQSIAEVLDLYLLAIMIGAHATLPRKRAERWNTVITDPDGHHVSIWAAVPRESKREQPLRRSPRWEWERAQRPGYEAGAARWENEMEADRPRAMPRGHDHPGTAPGADRQARSRSRVT
jgi:catechol 2,3-dioxygenase-like lactoylglutathione lyase family enzyme